jgi:ribonuclease HII
MQIARSEAQLIVTGIESPIVRMRKLQDSKSLTDAERKSLEQTIASAEHTLELARALFAGSGFTRSV